MKVAVYYLFQLSLRHNYLFLSSLFTISFYRRCLLSLSIVAVYYLFLSSLFVSFNRRCLLSLSISCYHRCLLSLSIVAAYYGNCERVKKNCVGRYYATVYVPNACGCWTGKVVKGNFRLLCYLSVLPHIFTIMTMAFFLGYRTLNHVFF